MKVLRNITLSAALVLSALFAVPAWGDNITGSTLIQNAVNPKNYEPDKPYFLFPGYARGSVTDRTGQIAVIPAHNTKLGSLHIQEALISGNVGYTTRFHNHPWHEHGPADHFANNRDTKAEGSPEDGFTILRLDWSGSFRHPADGYDGEQGGGHPEPTGARDEYSYSIGGYAQNIRFESDDTRSAAQRISDRYTNLPGNFSDRANEAHRQMLEHNPNLSRWGNGVEFVNGLFGAVANPGISFYEGLGMGDVVQGIKDGSAITTMHGLEGMSDEDKMAAVEKLAHTAGFADYAVGQAQEWAREHPNSAEAVKMWGNVIQTATGLRAAGVGKNAIASAEGTVSHSYRRAYTCSFHPDTQVKTEAGYKAIADIRVGDKVLARNERNGQTGYKEVLRQYSNPYAETTYIRIKDSTGRVHTIVSNTIHPFYSNGRWVQAGYLKTGERLLSESGSEQVVEKVSTEQKPLVAYNLNVSDWHTYFVRGSGSQTEGVWVHNECLTKAPSERYNRNAHYGGSQTNSSAAKEARLAGEGQVCPTCGNTMVSGTKTAPSPQHEPTLVQHYYEHGGHLMTNEERRMYARSKGINGSQCLICQKKEGAKMARYSREQAIKYGL